MHTVQLQSSQEDESEQLELQRSRGTLIAELAAVRSDPCQSIRQLSSPDLETRRSGLRRLLLAVHTMTEFEADWSVHWCAVESRVEI